MKIPQDVYEKIGKSRRRRYMPRRRGVFSLSSNAHVMRTPSLAEQERTDGAAPTAVDANGQGCTSDPDHNPDPGNVEDPPKPS